MAVSTPVCFLTNLFSTSCCAPYPRQGRNRLSEFVPTRGCRRDTVHGGAVATGVPYPVMGDSSCLRTVESRCAA